MNIDRGDLERVTPVNKVYNGNDTYSYRYSFDKVHLDDLRGRLGNVLGGVDAEYKFVDGGLYYKYDGMPAVYIEEFEVFAIDKRKKTKAKEQAYYVLSILESEGLVSGFKKK